MIRRAGPVYNRLLDRISAIPVIDCHEHLGEPTDFERTAAERNNTDPICFLIADYLQSDLASATVSTRDMELVWSDAPLDARWPIFQRLWLATEHGAYAHVTKHQLVTQFGIRTLTRESLDLIADKIAAHDDGYRQRVLREAGIVALATDVMLPGQPGLRFYQNPQLSAFLDGKYTFPEGWHPVMSLPQFHTVRRFDFVAWVGGLVDSNITSLVEYEEAVFQVLKKGKAMGVVALKNGSAYSRELAFDVPAKSDAERLFNRLLGDRRSWLGWPETKALEDHLFHQLMRFARELDLPVQFHTGHMDHGGNRVDKANAAHLASVMELHSGVRFDLFHGNWPYMGDILFLAKNYPNVVLDACWVTMIDPLYTIEMFKRAVMTVPHTKVHAFGGDIVVPELVPSHLALAREILSSALTDLVECGWLEEQEAVQIAADWLFNNPNRFFGFAFDAYRV